MYAPGATPYRGSACAGARSEVGATLDQHWTALAACRSTGPDDLFVEGAAQRRAREVCTGCAVRLDCLVDALDSRVPYGVWGGMTERERRALLRSRPDVVSWREEIAAATDAEREAGSLEAGSRDAGSPEPGPDLSLTVSQRRR